MAKGEAAKAPFQVSMMVTGSLLVIVVGVLVLIVTVVTLWVFSIRAVDAIDAETDETFESALTFEIESRTKMLDIGVNSSSALAARLMSAIAGQIDNGWYGFISRRVAVLAAISGQLQRNRTVISTPAQIDVVAHRLHGAAVNAIGLAETPGVAVMASDADLLPPFAQFRCLLSTKREFIRTPLLAPLLNTSGATFVFGTPRAVNAFAAGVGTAQFNLSAPVAAAAAAPGGWGNVSTLFESNWRVTGVTLDSRRSPSPGASAPSRRRAAGRPWRPTPWR